MTAFPSPSQPNQRPRLSLLFLLILCLLVLLLLMRISALDISSGHIQPRPPIPSSEASVSADLSREASMRQALVKEQWEQVFGADDREIAQALGIAREKCADFVGLRGEGELLLAESKGSHIDDAVEQFSNTLRGVRMSGKPITSVELRIYFNESTWTRLTHPDPRITNFGYRVQDGFIVYREVGEWVRLEVEGIAVRGLASP